MSQKSRAQRKWLHRAAAIIIVLASYFIVHRVTGHYDWKQEDSGRLEGHIRRQHWLDNKPLPRWIESLFQPASQFDELIGYSPVGRPDCILHH
jgi:hypothetical protein